MESTRPIRALTRGLDALTVLSSRGGSTVSEVAQAIRLPRTTVYRILETLCGAGFVLRDSNDDRYRLTVRVRALSAGFDDDAWVAQIARPLLADLGREIVWPVRMSTLLGTTMIVRETTSSPLAVERCVAGHPLPVLSTADGRVFLAFCEAAQRDALLDTLGRSGREADRLARPPRADLRSLLAEIKALGYASTSHARTLIEEIALSVPVWSETRLLASLTVSFGAALTQKAGVERFVPKLKECALRIGRRYGEQRGGARRDDAAARVAEGA